MLISFWSNMHGQGATSAATAAFASFIAQKTAYKTLVAHNHIERSALEGYFFKPSGQAGLDLRACQPWPGCIDKAHEKRQVKT